MLTIRKKFGCLAAVASIASGCATMGFTSDRDALIKTASFDHDCPKEKIQVLAEQEEGIGSASFKLDVCGTPRKYKRMGTKFYDAASGDPLSGK